MLSLESRRSDRANTWAILFDMSYTKDSPEPIGPLWEVVLPLWCMGVANPRASTSRVSPGRASSHTRESSSPVPTASADRVTGSTRLRGSQLVVARRPSRLSRTSLLTRRDMTSPSEQSRHMRFKPLPPFAIEEARIGMDVLAPGYPLPRRRRRSLDEPAVLEATVRGMRGHVTSDGIITGLGTYGALPSIELDLHPPGGLSGAPVFDWGFIRIRCDSSEWCVAAPSSPRCTTSRSVR